MLRIHIHHPLLLEKQWNCTVEIIAGRSDSNVLFYVNQPN